MFCKGCCFAGCRNWHPQCQMALRIAAGVHRCGFFGEYYHNGALPLIAGSGRSECRSCRAALKAFEPLRQGCPVGRPYAVGVFRHRQCGIPEANASLHAQVRCPGALIFHRFRQVRWFQPFEAPIFERSFCTISRRWSSVIASQAGRSSNSLINTSGQFLVFLL